MTAPKNTVLGLTDVFSMQNCYNSKKISRGEAEDLDGRLTTKHIQTLSFLQEIVNENKALKARLAELEVLMLDVSSVDGSGSFCI